MPTYEYRGLLLSLPEFDQEHTGYFEAARRHQLVVKQCLDCRLLRWEPGPACPFCTSLRWEWAPVSGRGEIYSYQIVYHSVLPGFRDWVPYPIVLVELDEQRGVPTPGYGLRITANLVDQNFRPEREERVAIGARVEAVFMDLPNGLTLPQFKLSGEPPRGRVWRHGG